MSKVVAEGHGHTPQQARSIETRERILTGAAEVFNQVGYAAATLRYIESQIGVSKGAIRYHFATKEDIARALIDVQHRIVMRLAEGIARSNSPAIEQAVMLSHVMAEQLVANPIVRGGIRLSIELSFTDDSPVGDYLDWVTQCSNLFERAQAEGDLAPGIDPGDLANHVTAAFTGIQIMSHVVTKRRDLEQRVDLMWQHLLRGVVHPDNRVSIDRIAAVRWVAGRKFLAAR